jgi:hypothetical protein
MKRGLLSNQFVLSVRTTPSIAPTQFNVSPLPPDATVVRIVSMDPMKSIVRSLFRRLPLSDCVRPTSSDVQLKICASLDSSSAIDIRTVRTVPTKSPVVSFNDKSLNQTIINSNTPKKGCLANEFTCADGSCVASQKKCDRSPDCSDRSDELNCRQFI